MKILLLIPAFDEEPRIASLIEQAKRQVPDIMVVDDGSEDATTLVSALAGAMVHRLKSNLGKGEALKTGFDYAITQGYEWVITMSGSGSNNPADIERFLAMLPGHDLIIGRRVPAQARLSLLRRMAIALSSLLVSAVAGRKIRDAQSGFRAYRSECLRQLELTGSGYDLDTELLVKFGRRGFRIGEIEVQTAEAGRNRYRIFRDSLRFFAALARSLRG